MDVRSNIPYGKAYTLYFELYEADASKLNSTPATFEAGDAVVIIDGGTPASSTNTPAHEGNGVYSLALTAAEVTGAEIQVVIADQTATQTWFDRVILLRTSGHPDAYDPQGVVAAGLLAAGGASGGTLPASSRPTYALEGYVLEVVAGAGIGTVVPIATYNTGTGAFTLEEPANATLDTTSEVKVYPAAKVLPSDAVSQVQSGLATAAALATVDSVVDAIKAVTDNLPDGGSLTTLLSNIAAILVDTGTDIPGLIAALNNLSAAEVAQEVSDALRVDTFALPGQEAPPANPTVIEALGWQHKYLRNKRTQSNNELSLFADDGVTVDAKATVGDDGTTFEKGEFTAGP